MICTDIRKFAGMSKAEMNLKWAERRKRTEFEENRQNSDEGP